jgi:hypothetical protein
MIATHVICRERGNPLQEQPASAGPETNHGALELWCAEDRRPTRRSFGGDFGAGRSSSSRRLIASKSRPKNRPLGLACKVSSSCARHQSYGGPVPSECETSCSLLHACIEASLVHSRKSRCRQGHRTALGVLLPSRAWRIVIIWCWNSPASVTQDRCVFQVQFATFMIRSMTS